MGKLFFAALMAALLVVGCVQPQAPQSQKPKQVVAPQILENGQPKTIMPESFGGVNYTYYSSPLFLAYYPRGWVAEEPGHGQFTFTAPVEGDPEKNVADQLIVEIVRIWAGDEVIPATPEAFTKYEEGFMRPGDQVTKKESTRFKGRDAFILEMEGADERTGAPMFFHTVYFQYDEWMYRLHYAMEQSRREKSEPLFKDLLDKFVIGSGD